MFVRQEKHRGPQAVKTVMHPCARPNEQKGMSNHVQGDPRKDT